MQVLIADLNECTGCKICELTCSMGKHGEYNPEKSYIKVLSHKEMGSNVIALDARCNFCGRCVDWCPYGALKIIDASEAEMLRKANKPGVIIVPFIKANGATKGGAR